MDTKRKLGVMKEIEAANKRHVEEWKREQAGRKITGVLVDVTTRTAAKVTVEKDLDSYYKILNCRCIDIVRRGIGGKRFYIICDDEALLTSSPRVSAVGIDGEMMLAGNLQSLTEAEIRHVLLNAKWLVSLVHHDIRCVLTNCTY